MQNYIGQKFGRLTILEHIHKNKYKAKCECGNTWTLCISDIIRTDNKVIKQCSSCHSGQKSALWRGYEEISGTLWSGYRAGAIYRGIEFNITIEDAWQQFIKQNRKCTLTGIELQFPRTRDKKTNISLDRIDSSKGYIKDNIQWTHKIVNLIKNNLNQNLFIKLCNIISRQNPIENIDLEVFNTECLTRHTPGFRKGKNHNFSKIFQIQNEDGNILTFKGIAEFCRENNLSPKPLRLNSRKNQFYKGWKILKYYESQTPSQAQISMEPAHIVCCNK